MMKGFNKTVKETLHLIPENSIGAELGIWKGDTSAKFLTKAKFLHMVDSWSVIAYENSDEHGDYDGYLQRYKSIVGSDKKEDFQKFYDKIYLNVKKRFKNSPVKIHRKTTKEWFETFSDKLDWIYVDANHSYDNALHDLQESYKRIHSGGILIADDYTNSKPGVRKAIEDFSAEINVPFVNFYKDQVYFLVS